MIVGCHQGIHDLHSFFLAMKEKKLKQQTKANAKKGVQNSLEH